MKNWCLGIDLCDDYSQLSYYNRKTSGAEAFSANQDEQLCLVPTILCKKKGSDQWFIGQEAYHQALLGDGIIVDRLVSLAVKSGTATMEERKYTAAELLECFIGKLLELILNDKDSRIMQLVFTVQKLEPVLMDLLVKIGDHLEIPRDAIHIVSHTEAYLYYVMGRGGSAPQHTSCLFDLTESGFHYYEMRVVRGRTPQIIEGIHEELEESFSLDILEHESGMKLADSIVCACAQRMLGKKVVHSVYLTGKGFQQTDWAPESLKLLCMGRRVFAGQNLFAQGAAYIAWDHTRPETAYPYICLCEGRISSTITMEVLHRGKSCQLVVAAAGSNWYEARADAELIVDQEDQIHFQVQTIGSPDEKIWTLSLDLFPKRPPRTTRLELIFAFVEENSMMVRVIDKGFGELFPSCGQEIKQFFAL